MILKQCVCTEINYKMSRVNISFFSYYLLSSIIQTFTEIDSITIENIIHLKV